MIKNEFESFLPYLKILTPEDISSSRKFELKEWTLKNEQR